MISNPEQGVPQEILKALRKYADLDNHYTKVHWRRYAKSLEILTSIIRGLETTSTKPRVLEIGTSATIPLALQDLTPGVEIKVTDFNGDEPVRALKLEHNGHARTVIAYRADLEFERIACDNESFDIVTCFEVLEHMEVDPMALLEEINRVLKPGGTLLLTTPNVCGSRNIAKILSGYDPYFYMQYNIGAKYHRHNYEYSVWSLRHLLTAAGFNGDIWTEDTWEDPATHTITTLTAAGYTLTDTGDNIFANLRKETGIRERYPYPIYDA